MQPEVCDAPRPGVLLHSAYSLPSLTLANARFGYTRRRERDEIFQRAVKYFQPSDGNYVTHSRMIRVAMRVGT